MSKKILIVDDSSSVRTVVRTALTREGYSVFEAQDGSEGLQKSSGEKFDLIISDINMPNMDGLSMVAKIKENPSTKFVPVIMLTTESEHSKIAQGKSIGVKAWMVKPFDAPKLSAAVKQLVR